MAPSDFTLGIVMNLVGSVFINLGTNVVKLSHCQQVCPSDLRTFPFNCCSTWATGVATFVCGNLLNFVSFSFAPQSLLAALGSVQFLSNVVFGVLLLKEEITVPTLVATGLIIAGNLVIVLHSSQTEQNFSTDDLRERYQERTYQYYLYFLCFLVIVLQWVYFHAKARYPQLEADRFRVIPFTYAAVSAIIGSQSVLLAKSTSILLKATITEDDQLSLPFSHVIMGAWMVTMSFWLYRMNTAIRRFDTLFIVPVLQVMWTLFSIIGGGLYFQEFNSFDTQTTVMFIFGVALVVSGVCVLANNSALSNKNGSFQTQSSELRELRPSASNTSLTSLDGGWVRRNTHHIDSSMPLLPLTIPIFNYESSSPLRPTTYQNHADYVV